MSWSPVRRVPASERAATDHRASVFAPAAGPFAGVLRERAGFPRRARGRQLRQRDPPGADAQLPVCVRAPAPGGAVVRAGYVDAVDVLRFLVFAGNVEVAREPQAEVCRRD